jgi:hypothetical protein
MFFFVYTKPSPEFSYLMQDGANVLFFTFINPSNMEVPRAFQKLGKLSTVRPSSIPLG